MFRISNAIVILGHIQYSLAFCPVELFLHPTEHAGDACYNKNGNNICDSNTDELCNQNNCEIQFGGYESYNCGHANYHYSNGIFDTVLVDQWISKCCFSEEYDTAGCLGGEKVFSFTGECSYNNVLLALGGECSEEELLAYLHVSNHSEVHAAVEDLCRESFSRHVDNFLDFSEISKAGYQFDREFMNGGSEWNNAYNPDMTRIQLTEDKILYQQGIHFPEYLHNFDTEQSCDLQAVMCCWTSDSSNAGNGSCNDSEGCQDGKPLNNTDVCFVNIEDSPLASHTESGIAVYPGDTEGNTNCMGFTWTSHAEDASNLYKGNLLFEVAMKYGLKENGYTRSVPHAPMCACVEQMPVVSHADCTDLDVVNSWSIYANPDSGLLSIDHSVAELTFNDCNGEDLATHYNTVHGVDLSERIVGECAEAEDSFVKEKGRFEKERRVKWLKVAGKGSYADPNHTIQLLNGTHTSMTRDEFNQLWEEAGFQILFRRCKYCTYTHQYVYYKRNDPNGLPPNVDVLYDVQQHWYEYENNTWGINFQLYSTLTDCFEAKNPWTHVNFNLENIGFPRDSGPYSHIGNNWNVWDEPFRNNYGQIHVGFFMAVPLDFPYTSTQ